MATEPFTIGFLLLPRLTQLDLTGPYEIFARMPGARVHLLWKSREPVRSDRGLAILPTDTLADCPPLDLLCVPGGPGVNPLLGDAEVLDFLRRTAARARYVTSVCTGSLVLGAAGLLRGRRAASHWRARDFLRDFGAEPVDERVVVDGNVITGGGVTAGIDFALAVVAALRGRAVAEAIQLQVEYDPDPPFAAGSPAGAPAAVLAQVTAQTEAMQRERAALVAQAAAALGRA
jgi:cyclohexyl-isocyanide hydratase